LLPKPVLFGAGCSRSRTSNVIFEALEKLNLEAMNKVASHELPTLPDLYLLLAAIVLIWGPTQGNPRNRKPVTLWSTVYVIIQLGYEEMH
jgi:hypothetical protein